MVVSVGALAKAQESLGSGGIGRSTKTIYEHGGRIYVEDDHFGVKLWEIGAVAVAGAAIWYVPQWMEAWLDIIGMKGLREGIEDFFSGFGGDPRIPQAPLWVAPESMRTTEGGVVLPPVGTDPYAQGNPFI